MEQALVNESNPLDADVEKVLPGVLQWHRDNSNELMSVRQQVSALQTTIQNGFGEISDTFQQDRQELASVLIGIARQLQNGASPNTRRNAAELLQEIRPPVLEEMSTNAPTEESIDDGFRMVMKHSSLQNLWDEWHGRNAFYDVKGGVKGRNQMYGSRWRKGIVKHHHYSRTQRIVEVIAKHAHDNDLEDDEAVRQFEAVFKEKKYSISAMVKYLQEEGLMDKRIRP